jgi:hypothetical protein
MNSKIAIVALLAFLTSAPCTSQWKRFQGREFKLVHSALFSGATLIVAADSGLYRYGKTDTSWTLLDSALLGNYVYVLSGDSTRVLAGTGGHGIYRSSDHGLHWSQITSALTTSAILSIAISGARVFVSTSGGLYESENETEQWTGFTPDPEIRSVAIRTVTNAVDSILVFGGTIYDGPRFSPDGGNTWTYITGGLPPPDYNNEVFYPFFRQFAFSAKNVVGATEWGVSYASLDSLQWRPGQSNVPLGWIFGLASIDTNVFAASYSSGISYSSDCGIHWNQINEGLPYLRATAVAIGSQSLFASVDGVLYSRAASDVITRVEEDRHSIPKSVTLDQNYPNPFNPTTMISYSLSSVSSVRLRVFDALGQCVSILVGGMQPAGDHHVVWNAAGLPSGLYFYQLQTGSTQISRKAILLK